MLRLRGGLQVEEGSSARSLIPVRLLGFGVALLFECAVAILLPHYRLNLSFHTRNIPFVFVVALLFFGWTRLDGSGLEIFRVRYRYVAANGLCFLAFLFLEHKLYVWAPVDKPLLLTYGYFGTAVALWVCLFVLLVLSLMVAVAPLRVFARISERLGIAWLYAGMCALLSGVVSRVASSGWNTQSLYFERVIEHATFGATTILLRKLYPSVISFPNAHILGTAKFFVDMKGGCSGIEGMGLIAMLTVAWLIFARRELQMGRAILLVPLSIAVMWCLNLVRLVVLLAIGTSGHKKLAMNGFHSVAGWIAFNLVSVAFLLTVNRIGWFRVPESEQAGDGLQHTEVAFRWRNVPAIYLAPFLAIVAASLITHATTGGFEWLYPLRFVVALAVLWAFRKEYRAIDWKFGWVGVAAGLVVAAVWLVVRLRVMHPALGPDVTTDGLAQLPVVERVSWIGVRVLAAVTTVPIAEELAFRGFVARRVMSADVESVPYARLSFMGILVSSALFGVMHGDMWVMGIVAGVVYALVAKWRGRLGEAVAAHAATNLAIAVVAVVLHNYSLW
jgi:exosortase E/protease (VPEID-CTERM system)